MNERDNNGAVPMYFAAQEGHVEVIRFLLQHNADPLAKVMVAMIVVVVVPVIVAVIVAVIVVAVVLIIVLVVEVCMALNLLLIFIVIQNDTLLK